MSSRIDTFFQWVWRLNGLLVFALALAGIAAMVFVTLNASSFKDARKPEQKLSQVAGSDIGADDLELGEFQVAL
jgi:hypothetical protein